MSDDKTKEQLATELELHKTLCREREASDQKYAIKLVERIVLAACGLVLIAVVTALIAMVVSR
jgi:lipopolysaccharide/colanic/teichoic acid biosynthesis glycosyltransferase